MHQIRRLWYKCYSCSCSSCATWDYDLVTFKCSQNQWDQKYISVTM